MQELRSLDTSQLIDLLSHHTATFSRMLNNGTTDEEYEKSYLAIKALQYEIELRKKSGTNTSKPVTDSTPSPDFS